MQAAWGGAFTYAAPDNAERAAPGQVSLGTMTSWRCHRLHPEHGVCGVFGSPLAQSPGPDFHNERFQRAFKDLIYLPFETDDVLEAIEAMEALSVLGASVTMPLKETLAKSLGACGAMPAIPPVNTMWRRSAGDAFACANTDTGALASFLKGGGGKGGLPPGPALVLGGGGVAKASLAAMVECGRPGLAHSRRAPLSAQDVSQLRPAGVVQATSLGMGEGDPLPFPEILEAALPTLKWAAEWVGRDGTAFCEWAAAAGLALVTGRELFERQAAAQSEIFVRECGGCAAPRRIEPKQP
jgi:shikimate 5-dehydrogenase